MPRSSRTASAEPGGVGHRQRLVEAVVLAQPGQLLLRDVELHARSCRRRRRSPRHRRRRRPVVMRSWSIWPPGTNWHQQEGGEGDAQNGGDHQQQPAHDVVAQRFGARLHAAGPAAATPIGRRRVRCDDWRAWCMAPNAGPCGSSSCSWFSSPGARAWPVAWAALRPLGRAHHGAALRCRARRDWCAARGRSCSPGRGRE